MRFCCGIVGLSNVGIVPVPNLVYMCRRKLPGHGEYPGSDGVCRYCRSGEGCLRGRDSGKESGLMRVEGRDYVIRDGDCIHCWFNV
jgi:hypothetical protein